MEIKNLIIYINKKNERFKSIKYWKYSKKKY